MIDGRGSYPVDTGSMPPDVAARYGSLIDRFQALSQAKDWTPAISALSEADELGKPYRVGAAKTEESPPQAQWTTTPKEAIRDSSKPIVLSLTPDVCKTPVGSSIPPIPYSVYAIPGEDEKTTPTVFFTGERAFVLRSNTTCTHGDEPGSAKGIKSGTVGDIAEPLDHSRTVRAEGIPVIRHEDRFYMNRGNTFGEVRMAGDTTTQGGGDGTDTRGAGERFADGFSENASETWEGAKKVGSDALEGAKSIASDLWNDPLGTLGSAGESVAGGVTGAAQWTGEVGQNLWNDPGGTLGRGWENTQNTAGTVWHGVSDPYVQAYREGGVAQALGHGTFDVVRLGVEALATKGAITVAGKAATVAGVARKIGAAEGAAAGVAEDVVPAARKAEQTAEEIERATPDENVRVTRTKRWVAKDVNGRKVYQRDDLIDPDRRDAEGRTNRERMADGDAPIGPDGEEVNLHHLTQDEPGSMAEISQSMHQEYNRELHMYNNQYDKSYVDPDGIRHRYSSAPPSMNRGPFNTWKRGYWKTRANDF
ncbi:PAAR-like domain-containing protein [Inquilinus sp. YAF38]|uniref:PAAR-like domain-containing protein n=1 Tax=Inquilinus sp. YAF38 TaxID=3233084 RepID=UPI003F8E8A6F